MVFLIYFVIIFGIFAYVMDCCMQKKRYVYVFGKFIKYVVVILSVVAIILISRYIIYAAFFWDIDEWQRFLFSILGIVAVYFCVIFIKNYTSK